jgi:hypothetical protein
MNKDNDVGFLARLVKGMVDIRVGDIYLLPFLRQKPKPIAVCLQLADCLFPANSRPQNEVF